MPGRAPRLLASLAVVAAFSAPTGQAQTAPESSPQGEPTPAAAAGTASAPPGLAEAVQNLLGTGAAAQAHWGIAVAAQDGTPLYTLDANKLFRPASTAKLFTTAAAFALLGPRFTVQTSLYGQLSADGQAVTGDLILVGGGDPSFGTGDLPYQPHPGPTPHSAVLASLADALRARGIRSVAGDVVGDDTLFGTEPPPAGWEAEDLQWGYGALPSALSFGDNELALTLAPAPPQAAAGPRPVLVSIDQQVPYLVVEDAATTLPAGDPRASGLGLTRSATGGPTLLLSGTLAANAPAEHEHVAVDEPARYAAQALQATLAATGIAVAGTARAVHTQASPAGSYLQTGLQDPACLPGSTAVACTPACPAPPDRGLRLASIASGTVAEETVFTLKTSANLHAEMLLRQIGLRGSCAGVGAVAGAQQVRAWLLGSVGLAPEDFVFYDGSGLSTKDLVTPHAEVALLAYAARQPWFAAWRAALPVGGVDGTLAHRFTQAPLRGQVFAKTGTLGETRALAGYLEAASGREVIFSILEDGHMPGTAAGTATLDRVVAALAAAF